MIIRVNKIKIKMKQMKLIILSKEKKCKLCNLNDYKKKF